MRWSFRRVPQEPAPWAVAVLVTASVLLAIAGGSARFLHFDAVIAQWIRAHTSRDYIDEALIITALGSTPVAVGIAMLSAIPIALKRWWYELLFLAMDLGGIIFLNPRLKLLFGRPRPSFADQTLTFLGTSFPSGHAMTSTALYGGLALVLLAHLPRAHRRGAIIAASVLIGVISLTRLYLGAHFLTDVIAGIAFGLLWLAICELALASVVARTGANH